MMIRHFFLLCVPLLGGCASTYHNPKDPLESFNRSMYTFNDTVDKAVLKPVAKGYNAVVPAPGRMMISNFFSNLDDVIVAANDLLQLKVKQALRPDPGVLGHRQRRLPRASLLRAKFGA
jgi:phospholipid-binding lipoprotein MlaA